MNPLLLTLALLHSSDIAITNYGIAKQGGREANPLLPKNPISMTIVTSSITTGQIYLLHKVSKDHPRLAKILAFAAIGTEGFITYHNVGQLR
jgi:hypothetical protein